MTWTSDDERLFAIVFNKLVKKFNKTQDKLHALKYEMEMLLAHYTSQVKDSTKFDAFLNHHNWESLFK